MSDTPLPPDSSDWQPADTSSSEPSGTTNSTPADSQTPQPAASGPARKPWNRRASPALIAILAAVAVVIAGGIVLAVRSSGGTDSGVAGCKSLASDNENASAADASRIREQFAGSSDEALRTPGVDLMDIAIKLQAEDATLESAMANVGPMLADWDALTAACANHGVTLPAIPSGETGPGAPDLSAPGEPTPAPTPSEEPSAPPAAAGVVGQPFTFHTTGGTTTSGNAAPADVSLTVKPLTCGLKNYTIPARDYEPEKQVNAPAGMRYCQADLTEKNISRTPVGQLTFGGQLTTTDVTVYNQDDQATTDLGGDITANSNSESYGDNTTPELNPGQTAYTAVVWAIPTGAAPEQLQLTEEFSTDESTGEPLSAVVTVDPSQIEWLNPKGQ